MTPYDVLIVGAGFSGTLVAVTLTRRSQGTLRIALAERGGDGAAGRGVAYATPDRRHLLNVRAGGMSAFADQPDHFVRWLAAHPAHWEGDMISAGPHDFVPRLVYGRYLQDLLRTAMAEHGGVDIFPTEITDLAPGRGGFTAYQGTTALLTAGQVVLALGNFPPGDAATGTGAETTLNPYAPSVLEKICGPGDVFLIGTGLTSLDLLATMEKDKADGRIHVLSRGGLFPRQHGAPAANAYPAYIDRDAPPRTALALLSLVRREIRMAMQRGVPWQDVIDALRPFNQALWLALPVAERRRFLRRVRPYWDTHRHRAAAEIIAARDRLLADGRLVRHRGAYLRAEPAPDAIDVVWRETKGKTIRTTRVAHVVNCTGPQADIRKLKDPLVAGLLARDLITPDILQLGIDADAAGRVLNAAGTTVPGLYLIGSWRKGALFESVAVPELRGQADALALEILRGG